MDIIFIITLGIIWMPKHWAGRIGQNAIPPSRLPRYFQEKNGRAFATFSDIILTLCIIALLIWAFMHLKWYMAILNIVLSFVLAGITYRIINPFFMIVVGWAIVAGLTLFVWFR